MTTDTFADTTSPQRARTEALLRRYPDVDAQEREDIRNFLDKGPILEIGLMTGDPMLKPKVEQFKRENAAAFKLGIGKQFALLMILAVPLLIFSWYVWDSGAKP